MMFNTLREWKLACPKSPVPAREGGELDLVFPNTSARFSRSPTCAPGAAPLAEEAGMVDATGEPLFNFHTLRHFFASWAIERGFTPKRLQALLGHSSIQMNFDRYGNLFPSRSSWLGVVVRGAFPAGLSAEPVAVAADSPLTVAGAAPALHRTSLSHRNPDAIMRGPRTSSFDCYFDRPGISCRVEQRRGG